MAAKRYRSIQEIRRDNLRRILVNQYDNNQRRLAAAYRAPPSFINRLLKSKAIGDAVARALEALANRPLNWLDQEHEKSDSVERAAPPIPSFISIGTLRREGRMMKEKPHLIAALGNIMTSRLRIPLTPTTFATEVIDSSMEPLLHEGDNVLVNPFETKHAKKGDIVLVFAGDDVYLRRYSLDAKGAPIVEALNKAWPKRVIKLGPNDWIAGKVIAKLELIV